MFEMLAHKHELSLETLFPFVDSSDAVSITFCSRPIQTSPVAF